MGVSLEAFAKRFFFAQKTNQGSKIFHIEVFLEDRVDRIVPRTVPTPLSPEWSNFRLFIVGKVEDEMRILGRSLGEAIVNVSEREWVNPIDGTTFRINPQTVLRWFNGMENIARSESNPNRSSPASGKREVLVFLHVGQNTKSLVRVPEARAWVVDSSGVGGSKLITINNLPGSKELKFVYDIEPQVQPKDPPRLSSVREPSFGNHRLGDSRPIELFVIRNSPEKIGIQLLDNSPLENFFPNLLHFGRCVF